MTKRPDTDRDRLILAAMQTRDWLRGVACEIDRAVTEGGPTYQQRFGFGFQVTFWFILRPEPRTEPRR